MLRPLVCLLLAFSFAIATAAIAAPEKGEKGGKKAGARTPEKIFAKLDKDGDGKLTVEEFVGKKKEDQVEKAKKRFAKLDKDGDGALTLDEFKAGARKGGGKKGKDKKKDA